MIKTNELRVGNFVSVNRGFEMVVHSIFGDDTVYLDFIPPLVNEGDVWEENSKDISPIPLTEEWLLAFKFEQIDKLGGFLSPKVNGQRLRVRRDPFDPQRFYFVMNTDWIIDVPSVHQLQNLYFAFTNFELTK